MILSKPRTSLRPLPFGAEAQADLILRKVQLQVLQKTAGADGPAQRFGTLVTSTQRTPRIAAPRKQPSSPT